MTMIQTKKYDLAASNLAIDAELMPDNWRLLYNLACAYALKDDKRRAVETLNKAVQKGFKNAAELERNDQLDAIREEAGFKKIVEGLKKQSLGINDSMNQSINSHGWSAIKVGNHAVLALTARATIHTPSRPTRTATYGCRADR